MIWNKEFNWDKRSHKELQKTDWALSFLLKLESSDKIVNFVWKRADVTDRVLSFF